MSAALRLYEDEADRLLLAAGHPAIAELIETAQAEGDEVRLASLAHWLRLRRQAAPVAPSSASVAVRAAPFQAPHHIAAPFSRRRVVG